MAKDIFQSNLYPGDTDFRIYRDFGWVAAMQHGTFASVPSQPHAW